MRIFKLKNFSNFYIHEDGYVIKRYGGKETIVPIKISKTVPKIKIAYTSYNFIFLMLEYFGDKSMVIDDKSQYRFKYKMIDGKIPFSSIKLIRYNSNKHEDKRVFQFKCIEKSISANSRVSNISTISENDVFDCLLRTDFKCTYCNRNLDFKTWELDHVHPLSKGGLNVTTNITPSCKRCNRMKSNLELMDFIHTCKLISLNFEDSVFFNEDSFRQKTQKL
jgi:hypothetical protein